MGLRKKQVAQASMVVGLAEAGGQMEAEAACGLWLLLTRILLMPAGACCAQSLAQSRAADQSQGCWPARLATSQWCSGHFAH